MASDRAPALRPLGVGDVLDELFAVYRRGFKTFMAIAAIVHLPLALLSLPLAMTSAAYWREQQGGAWWFGTRYFAGGPMEPWQSALSLVLVLFSTVAGCLEMGAIVHATSALYVGEPSTVGGAYRQAFGRFWALFRIGVLLVVAAAAVMVVWLLPAALGPALICVTTPLVAILGMWLVVRWSLAIPALVVERVGASQALRRSTELVRGAWWRSFVTLLLVTILSMVLWLLAVVLVGAIIAGAQAVIAPGLNGPADWAAILESLLNNVVGWLVAPLFYIGVTILYYDRRVRGEAYDLSLMARDLAAPPQDFTAP
jgi:hypothetical protein